MSDTRTETYFLIFLNGLHAMEKCFSLHMLVHVIHTVKLVLRDHCHERPLVFERLYIFGIKSYISI